MIDEQTLSEARRLVEQFFAGDASGHDGAHTMRVYRLARRIASEEGADEHVVGLAALLHDVDDHKLSPDTTATLGNARAFLEGQGVAGDEAQAILTAIREVSFSRNGAMPPSTIEAACVRDADRLDAMGAIGIARTFAYGGAHGRALYDEGDDASQTSIAHFHDKLLLLRDMMATESGRRIAEGRHRVLEEFLEEFMSEWDGLR